MRKRFVVAVFRIEGERAEVTESLPADTFDQALHFAALKADEFDGGPFGVRVYPIEEETVEY